MWKNQPFSFCSQFYAANTELKKPGLYRSKCLTLESILLEDRYYVVFMFTFCKSGIVPGAAQEVNENPIEA